MRIIALLVFALCTMPLAAQVAPQPPTQPSVPTGTLTGTVICSDTHLPAHGAIVVANFIPSADNEPPVTNSHGSTMTASDGTYSFNNLAPGDYAVLILLPGYLSGIQEMMQASIKMVSSGVVDPAASRQAMMHQRSISVRANQTAHFDVTLERGAALNGHVRFTDGTPASQVMLQLESADKPPAMDNAARMEENMEANLTSEFTKQVLHPDDRGQFRLNGVKPGSYRLAVLIPMQGEGRDGIEVIGNQRGISPSPYSTHFYAGDTTHSGAAQKFDLKTGQEVDDIVITLPLNAFHVVRGSVHSPDGQSPSAIVTLTDTADPTLAFSGATNDDGTFRFPQVPAGSYTLRCGDAFLGKLVSLPEDKASGGLTQVWTNAFAGQTVPVQVADSDVNGIDLVLKEKPLPDSMKPGGYMRR